MQFVSTRARLPAAATVDEEGRGSDSEAYEHSEMALYKALVLEEGAWRGCRLWVKGWGRHGSGIGRKNNGGGHMLMGSGQLCE